MQEGRLKGKVALITGGASGIGRACALRFAEEGADIVIADLDAARGGETALHLKSSVNGRALFIEVDTGSEASIETMVDRAMAEYGRIDIAVAAAGISNAQYVSGAAPAKSQSDDDQQLLNMPLSAWQRVLDINLTGLMLTDRAVARRMVAGGHPGAIVNLASTAARVPLTGAGEYSVSKAGVVMLTQVLAMELLPHNIRVNAIGPGFVETPMTAAMNANDEGRAMMLGMTPMGRLGTVDEMANTALYLASDESSYTTGATLYPNGGMTTG